MTMMSLAPAAATVRIVSAAMASTSFGDPLAGVRSALPASLSLEAPPSRTPPLRRTESTKNVYGYTPPTPPHGAATRLYPALLLHPAAPSPQIEPGHGSPSSWSPTLPRPALLSRSASAPSLTAELEVPRPESAALIVASPQHATVVEAAAERAPDFIFDFSQGCEHRFTPSALQRAIQIRLCQILKCNRAPEGEMYAQVKTSWFTYKGEMSDCLFHGEGEFKIFGRRPWSGLRSLEWCGEFGLHSLPGRFGGAVVSHKGSWGSGRAYEGDTRYEMAVIRRARYEAGNPRLPYTLTNDPDARTHSRALPPDVTIEGECNGREMVFYTWETPEGRFTHEAYCRGIMRYKNNTEASGKMEAGGVFVKDGPIRNFLPSLLSSLPSLWR